MRIVFVFALVCAMISLSYSQDLEKTHYCLSENDDSFLNKCHKQGGVLALTANFLVQWINPRVLAITALFLILLLPLLHLSDVKQSNLAFSLRKFNQNQLYILNFMHRVCYTLVLDVALYAAFRQSRPCRCTVDGGKTFQHQHSIYGSDAMSGAIFAATLFDGAPYNKYLSKIFAVIVIVLINAERVVLGYHSVAQVTVGSCLGIALHLYSTRTPQFFVFIDAIVQFILGAVLLQVDPALKYNFDDMNNLFSWFIWGVSFQVFVVLMLLRFYAGNWSKLKYSLFSGKLFVEGDERMQLRKQESVVNEDQGKFETDCRRDVVKLSNFIYTLFALFVLLIINYVSYVISAYRLTSH
ncbi:8 TM domain-containing transmembrane protein [Acrasis kona]|uniref:8 TM domain-containing transmembrane protein n=1 Tax=Acrasis kona TaxID=1008807 RepID=A0AAW2ZEC5_9EUKA